MLQQGADRGLPPLHRGAALEEHLCAFVEAGKRTAEINALLGTRRGVLESWIGCGRKEPLLALLSLWGHGRKQNGVGREPEFLVWEPRAESTLFLSCHSPRES